MKHISSQPDPLLHLCYRGCGNHQIISSEPNWQENSDHSVSPQCGTQQVSFWKAHSRVPYQLLMCRSPRRPHKQLALFTPSPLNGLKPPFLSFQTVCFHDVKQALGDWGRSPRRDTDHSRRSWVGGLCRLVRHGKQTCEQDERCPPERFVAGERGRSYVE